MQKVVICGTVSLSGMSCYVLLFKQSVISNEINVKVNVRSLTYSPLKIAAEGSLRLCVIYASNTMRFAHVITTEPFKALIFRM